MMIMVVLRLTLLFGLLVLCLSGRELLMLFVILPFCLVLLVFGVVSRFLLVCVVSLLRMLGFGLTLFLFWLRFLPFWAPCIGWLLLVILALGVSHLLNYLFCMSFGLVSGFLLRKLFLGIGELDVQFQCRLFRLFQALIFGVLVGFLELFFVPFLFCLVVLVFLPGSIGANQVVFGTWLG